MLTFEEILKLIGNPARGSVASSPLSLNEAIEIFGRDTFIELCDDKIHSISNDILMLFKSQQESTNELEEMFIKDELDDKRSQIRKWEFRLSLAKGNQQPNAFDLERIKEIPIGNIMPTDMIYATEKSVKYLCPIHNEKTPSFHWYKEKNNFHCFGCNSHGSVIDLYMALNKVEFKQACIELQSMV